MSPRTYRREELPVWFGKYRLLERLGFGGMAEVFRAELPGEAGFVKPTVIKRILPHLAGSDEMVELFLAEARLLARAHHKCVVQVFELGRSEHGEFYIAMELVDGGDLLGLLRGTGERGLRLSPTASAYVVAEVLSGLAYMHGLTDPRGVPLGVVHRDVSPSNVFVSREGEVKVGDFGVAKSVDVRHVTAVGMVKGKLEYASPEQIQRGKLDGRADVFGAGVLLWEMLAQRRLFGAEDDREVRKQVLHAERPSPALYRGDIPPELEALVMRSLAIDPAARFSSAKDFQRALQGVLRTLGTPFGADDLAAIVRTIFDSTRESLLDPLQTAEGELDMGFDDREPALLSRAVYYLEPPAPEPRIVRGEPIPAVAPNAPLPSISGSPGSLAALGFAGIEVEGAMDLPVDQLPPLVWGEEEAETAGARRRLHRPSSFAGPPEPETADRSEGPDRSDGPDPSDPSDAELAELDAELLEAVKEDVWVALSGAIPRSRSASQAAAAPAAPSALGSAGSFAEVEPAPRSQLPPRNLAAPRAGTDLTPGLLDRSPSTAPGTPPPASLADDLFLDEPLFGSFGPVAPLAPAAPPAPAAPLVPRSEPGVTLWIRGEASPAPLSVLVRRLRDGETPDVSTDGVAWRSTTELLGLDPSLPLSATGETKVAGRLADQQWPIVFARLWRLRSSGRLVVASGRGVAAGRLVTGTIIALDASFGTDGSGTSVGIAPLLEPAVLSDNELAEGVLQAIGDAQTLFHALARDARTRVARRAFQRVADDPGARFWVEPRGTEGPVEAPRDGVSLLGLALAAARALGSQALAREARGLVGMRVLPGPQLVGELPNLRLTRPQEQFLRHLSEGSATLQPELLAADDELALLVVGLSSGLLLAERRDRPRRPRR